MRLDDSRDPDRHRRSDQLHDPARWGLPDDHQLPDPDGERRHDDAAARVFVVIAAAAFLAVLAAVLVVAGIWWVMS